MQTIGGSTINSITGLFVQIFADENETHQYQLAIMSEKILYWLVHMKKLDYEFYRSDEEWMGDIGLTRYKLRKLRDKLAPVFICQSKHNYQRTKFMHYQLDGEALLTAIAKVYGRSTIYLRALLFDRHIEKPHFQQSRPKIEKPDFSLSRETTAKSLTTLPSNVLSSLEDKTNTTTIHAGGVDNSFNQNSENNFDVGTPSLKIGEGWGGDDSPQVDNLVKVGIWRKVAKKYAWIPEGTLNSMIQSAKNKQSSGELRQGLPEYLAGTLKNYAENVREEYQRALAHNPETKFDDFISTFGHGSQNLRYGGLTWADFAEKPDYTSGKWSDIVQS
jgi:hypothetical protein